MCEIAFLVIGAVLGFGLSRLQAWTDRMRRVRDEFFDRIAGLHALVDAAGLNESEAFKRSLEEVCLAVWKVQRHVKSGKRKALLEALDRYKQHHPSEFAPGLARTERAIKGELEGSPIRSHKHMLHAMLKELEDCLGRG